MKKIISTLLAILLFTSSFSMVTLADEAPKTETLAKMMAQVSNGKTTEYYEVVSKEGDLYFSAEDVSKITGYLLKKGEKYSYKLGEKTVDIDIKTGDVKISVLDYKGNIGEPIGSNEKYYFSASQLFPLMNVVCNVGDGIFYAIADEASLWKVFEDFKYSDYMFNVHNVYGETKASAKELSSMMILDGFANLKMERLIADDEKSYIAAIAELGQKGIAYDTNTVGTVQGLDSFEEVFGISTKDTAIQVLQEPWDSICVAANRPEKVAAYAKTFGAYKTFELMLETDEEYREYITWLSKKGTKSPVLDKALQQAESSLKKNEKKLNPLLADFSKQVLSAVSSDVFKAMANPSLDQKVVTSFNQQTAATTIFGTLANYNKVTEEFYGELASEEVKGYDKVARINVLESIQDYCWNLAKTLEKEPMTEENHMLIRQSYLTALRASKQLYESEVWKDFGKDHSEALAKVNGKIKQLVVSSDAIENDLLKNQENDSKDIKELVKKVKLMSVDKHKLSQIINTARIRNLLLNVARDFQGTFSTEAQLLQRLEGYVFIAFGAGMWDKYPWVDNYSYLKVPAADVHNHIYNVFGIKVSRVKCTYEGMKYSGGKYYIGGSDYPLQTYKILGTEESEKGYVVRIGVYYEDYNAAGYPYEAYGGQYRFHIESCDNANGMKIVAITR